MLRPAPHIRYHIEAILVVDPVFSGAAHWILFIAQYKKWIRPSGHGVLEFWSIG